MKDSDKREDQKQDYGKEKFGRISHRTAELIVSGSKLFSFLSVQVFFRF